MIAFINEHRDIYGVEPICKVLPIAPSTYRLHAARQRDPSLLPDRARRDLVLMAEIELEGEAVNALTFKLDQSTGGRSL